MAKKMCFLTFDDGPDPYKTPRVLRILERAGIKATFFCIGGRVAAHPSLVRDTARRGHAVENHTQTHPELHHLDEHEVRVELEMCSAEIMSLGLPKPTYFRPPHGFGGEAVYEAAAEQRLDLAMWSIDPEDWNDPDPVDLFAHVMKHMGDVSVVLLHDGAGGDATLQALPYLIRGLQVRGYDFGLLRDTRNKD